MSQAGVINAGGGGGGAGPVDHLTADTGGQLNPDINHNFNLLGQTAGGIQVMETNGSVSTITFEDRTRISAFVVDPSSTVGLRGTFTTVQSAINAAVSGQTVYVRPGNYVENLTLVAGVDLIALTGDGYSNTVAIQGSITATYSGRVTIDGFQLIAGASNGITISGANPTVLTLKDCDLTQASGGGIFYSLVCSNANASSFIFDSFGTTNVDGAFYNISAGTHICQGCTFINSGGSTNQNLISNGILTITNSDVGTDNTIGLGFTVSGGGLTAIDCNFSGQIISSGTGRLSIESCRLFTSGAIALTVGGSQAQECYNSIVIGGTASAVSISSSLQMSNCTVNSSNTNAITGAGTLNFGNLIFVGTSSLINTTTQVPYVCSNNAVRVTTPGAYPYTTVPQDNLILVDTSSGRTITPLASPTTGQIHRIKDNVGSAASNNITITPSGKNIDGQASYVIGTNWGAVNIIYNGTQWNVL